MKVKIVAVHPTTIVVTADNRQFELPSSAFPTTPQPHQQWTLSLEHEPTDTERLAQLNRYLARA